MLMFETILLFDDVPKSSMQIRVKAQAIVACEPTTYPMSSLKRAYNEEFTAQGVDVYVTDCKQIRGAFSNHLVVDMSVAAEGPIPVAVAYLIIFLIGLLATTVAAIVLMSVGSALAEKVWPKPKFYAADGKEFDSLAAYVTYQQATHPSQYVCHYCGQIFDIAEERNAHEKECPWKGGVPDKEELGWVKWLVGGIIVIGGIVLVSKVLPERKDRKRRMRIV